MIRMRKFNRIQERITQKFLDNFKKDVYTFLKNINRVDSWKDLYEVNLAIERWYNQYFVPKILKNIAGEGRYTNYANTEWGKEIKEFGKFFRNAFMPTKLDYKKYLTRIESTFNPFTHYSDYEDALHTMRRKIERQTSVNEIEQNVLHGSMWDFYFRYVWDEKSVSKYNTIKKKVDNYLDNIQEYYNTYMSHYGKGWEELNIEDTRQINGVIVHLSYQEERENEIRKMLGRMESITEGIKESGFEESLDGLVVYLNPHKDVSGELNYLDGLNVGTGGNYNRMEDVINVFGAGLGPYMYGLLAHEIGHRFYYVIMGEEQREQWVDFLNTTLVQFDEKDIDDEVDNLREVFEEYKKMFNDELNDRRMDDNPDENLEYLFPDYTSVQKFLEYFGKNKDLINSVIESDYFRSDILNPLMDDKIGIDMWEEHSVMPPNVVRRVVERFRQVAIKLLKTSNVLKKLSPTQYASKNESEFFAETFAIYSLFKAKNKRFKSGLDAFKEAEVYQSVFEKFIEVTRVRR